MWSFFKKWFWKIMSLPAELLAYIALGVLLGAFGFVCAFGMIAFIIFLTLFLALIIFLLLFERIRSWYIGTVEINRIFLGDRRISKELGIRDYSNEVCYDN